MQQDGEDPHEPPGSSELPLRSQQQTQRESYAIKALLVSVVMLGMSISVPILIFIFELDRRLEQNRFVLGTVTGLIAFSFFTGVAANLAAAIYGTTKVRLASFAFAVVIALFLLHLYGFRLVL